MRTPGTPTGKRSHTMRRAECLLAMAGDESTVRKHISVAN